MLKDRAWILAHVPHQGRMCLLDGVEQFDAAHVRCVSHGQGAADHPLRAHGRLGAAAGIEIAAQAIAVHGALLDPQARPRAGVLASVRAVALRVARLDDIPGPLLAEAERLGGDAITVRYAFALRAGARLLLDGRATVVIDPAALAAAGGA